MHRPFHLSALLLAGFLLAAPVVVWGQQADGSTQFRFEKFNLPNGGLGNHLQCMAQDSLGFMWFGSQYGLHRWDGYQFKTFMHDPLDSTSISSSYVESMYVARDGSLWLGTLGNGLNHFDPATEVFTRYWNHPDDLQSLSSNFVTDILEDNAGNIWVATADGLNRLDRASGKFKRYHHDPNDTGSISYDKVLCLYLDSEGVLWVGTGWAWEWEAMGGLNRYDSDTDSFIRYQYEPGDTGSLISNRVFDVLEDSRGNFWVATAGDGLHLMDRENRTFTRLENTPERAGQISAPYIGKRIDEHVRFIFEDNGQNIWIGSWQGGLKFYSPKTGEIQYFHQSSKQASTVPDNYLWDMFQSKDGTLWGFTAGPNASVFKIIRSTNAFSSIFTSAINVVESFYKEEDGTLWMGTLNGLYRINKDKNEFHVLKNDPAKWHSLGGFDDAEILSREEGNLFDDIYRIVKDREGYFWFLSGSEIGARSSYTLRYHPETGALKHFIYDEDDPEGLSSKWIVDLLADAEGRIWIATGDGVLNRYSPETDSFEHFRPDYPPDIQDEDNSHFLYGVLGLNKDGNVLFAGKRGTDHFSSMALFLYELDVETGAFKDYQISFNARDTWIDDLRVGDDGTVWVITRYAIIEIDPLSGEARSLEMAELGTSYVCGMVIDEQGIFWILGDGLVAYDPEEKTSFVYGSSSGIDILPFNSRSIYKSPDGQVYIGGQGAQFFYPDKLIYRSPETTSPVIVSGFSLPYQRPREKGNILLTEQFQEDPVIRLKHHENVFTFRFATLDFFRPENNQHEFQLEGYDEGWRKAGLEPIAQYTKVPPGTYTFRVRAADHTGNWKEARPIQLIISPPWWGTWWAYLLYGIAFVGIIVGAYQFQLRRSLDRAEALRLKELDAVKTRLYSNITHEFRTPLTIISGMATQIREHPNEWLDDGIRMIQRNSNRLLELVNQMLDLSKLENGKLGLHLQQDDIVHFLKYVVESIHSYAESQKVLVHFHAEMDELIMDFDQEKMQQILINLLSNAVKFTPERGHVYVSVQTAATEQAETVLIKVRDTGKGIHEEEILHIFDRFHQVDDGAGGTGIGLALTRELARLMDGDVRVKSKVGRGAEFTVELPVRREALIMEKPRGNPGNTNEERAAKRSAEAAGQALIPPLAAGAPHSSKPLLLLAEDNPDVVAYLAACLEGRYRLAVAKDGREGLDMATQLTPDLIISDVMMPYMDGFELARALRQDERTSHIPLIMLTARADMDSKLEGLEEGADAYLAKPFHKGELLTRIRKLLELRRQLQEYYLLLAGGGASKVEAHRIPQVGRAEDGFVEKAKKIVDEHLDDFEFTVEQFCREIGMSNSQLHRKLTAVTGLSATKFIRYVRLNEAKALLQHPNMSITAVAFDTGFNDPSYFGRVFKKEFGLTPGEWQEQCVSAD